MNSHPPTGLRRLMINDSNQYREKGKYNDGEAAALAIKFGLPLFDIGNDRTFYPHWYFVMAGG